MKSTKTKKTSTRSSRKTTKRKAPKPIASLTLSKTTIDGTLPPALEKVVEKLKSLKQQLGLGWKRDALLTYEIGAYVAKVRQERATYGSKAVETLAKELKIDRATLYRWAKVATTWAKAAFAQLAERRSDKSGLPLTWSHFELLADEKDSKRREKMLERALDEALTVVDLRAILKGGPKRTSGRTLPVTTTSPKFIVWNLAHDLVEEQAEMVKALSSITDKPLTAQHAELMKELYASCKALLKTIEPVVSPTAATSDEPATQAVTR